MLFHILVINGWALYRWWGARTGTTAATRRSCRWWARACTWPVQSSLFPGQIRAPPPADANGRRVLEQRCDGCVEPACQPLGMWYLAYSTSSVVIMCGTNRSVSWPRAVQCTASGLGPPRRPSCSSRSAPWILPPSFSMLVYDVV